MDAKKLEKLVVIVSSLKSKVKCPICLDHIEHSVQLECQHRFCSTCISHLRKNRPANCPLCKSTIGKRSPLYKDEFADSLAKFINVACQIIKEKYAHDVDSLGSGKLNLQKVIEVAPPDVNSNKQHISKSEICPEVFQSVRVTSRSKIVNSHKKIDTIHPFTDKNIKHKVISWLNEFDKFTPYLQSDEVIDFAMPSISQVALAEQKLRCSKKRSQSLTICENLPEPLVRRYQSLTEHLNHRDDDYSIEETPSQSLVKQVERKVVQDLLEDEYLHNLDQVAQESVKIDKPVSAKKRKKSDLSTKKSKHANDSGSSSGWDRIKKVKNCLEKAAKMPKQLKIQLQERTDKRRKSLRNLNVVKEKSVSPKEVTVHSNAEQVEKTEIGRTFNLSLVEEQFKKHFDNMAIEEASATITAAEITVNAAQKDDDICTKLSDRLTNIEPIPNDCEDLDSVAIQLRDKLKAYQSKARELPHDFRSQQEECFTNLLAYAEKIIQITKASHLSQSPLKSVATQTRSFEKSDVAVQTDKVLELKTDKNVQTSKSECRNGVTQTDLSDEVSGLRSKKEKEIVPQNISDKPIVRLSKVKHVVADSPKGLNIKKKSASQIKVLSKSSHASKSSKPVYISEDESREKSTKASNISDGSELLISLGSFSKSQKKINRKLLYDEPKSDNSDSEHDDSSPKKRKLIRDDLTVEFLDTEAVLSPKAAIRNERSSTPDSEKMDYDQYLLDVMSKYDPGPSTTKNEDNKFLPSPAKKCKLSEDIEKKTGKVTEITSSLNEDHVFTSCTALDNIDLENIESHQPLPRSFNTELDLVENTPMVNEKPLKLKLSSKKTDLESKKCFEQPEQIISKGIAPTVVQIALPNVTEISSLDKTGTLNQKTALQTQSDDLPNDLADMLKDLKNGENLFQDDFESQAKEIRKSPSSKIFGGDEFEDGQEFEDKMNKISFTTDENGLYKHKVNIVQDVVLMPEDEHEIEESDESGSDIVDSTPQKIKPNLADRSILRDIEINEQNEGNYEEFALCLPPPPGFDDADFEDIENHSPVSHKEDLPPDSTTTPDRLSDFIVSPDHKLMQSEKLISQHNLSLNTSALSPIKTKTRFKTTVSPRTSEIMIEETEGVFSPVAKASVRQSQCKLTPILSVSRSSKKSVILTSTPTQKSILNFVVPTQQSSSQKPCIMWSRIINKDLNVFTQLECKKLLTTAKVFNNQVTHLVVLVDERGRIVSHTAKTLQAIAAGIWVVRYEWVEDCLRMNRIIPEEPYEALDSTGQPGPQTARLTSKFRPLFKDFRFLCSPPLKSVPKSDLENIIRLAGGDIANDVGDCLFRDGKTNLIITESEFTEDVELFEGYLENFKIVTVDVEWLSCCIGQYKLLSFRPYVVAGDESTIGGLGYPSILIETVPFTLTETNG